MKKKPPVKKVINSVKRTATGLQRADLSGNAAALAFHLFLSFIPTLILVSIVYSGFEQGSGQLETGMGFLNQWLPVSFQKLSKDLSEFLLAFNSSGLFLTTVILIIWASSNGIVRFFRFLERLAGDRVQLKNWRLRSRAIALNILFGLLATVVIWISGIIPDQLFLSMPVAGKLLKLTIPGIFATILFFTLIKIGSPNRLNNQRVVLISFFGSVIWISITMLLDRILSLFPLLQTSASLFGTVFLLMMWLYATAWILLLAGWVATRK